MATGRSRSYVAASGAGIRAGIVVPGPQFALTAVMLAVTAGLVFARVVPTVATLAIAASATVSVALSGTVTLNSPADQAYTVSLTATVGTLSASSVVIAQGQTTASFTLTQASAGSSSVDFTISPSITRAGRPTTVTAATSGSATPFRNVRTGLRYASLKNALDAGAISGDTIKLTGGNYVNGANRPGDIYLGTGQSIELDTLTLEWEVPGDPMIVDNSEWSQSHYGVGIGMGANCRNLTIRGLWIKGYRLPYDAQNCGVYCLPGYNQGYAPSGPYGPGFFGPVATLTVEYCKFWQHTNGILTNHNHNLTLNIRYTTFEDCTGGSTGLTHGIYTGAIAALNVRGCTFTTTASAVGQPGAGHLIKSRAAITNVQGSLLDPAFGCARAIDVSNGGQCSITGNVLLHYGAVQTNDDNQVIAYGPEQVSGYATTNYAYDGRTHSLLIAQNTIRKRQPAQSYQIAVLWDAVIETSSGTPITYTRTVQNNIVAHDMPAAAAAFGSAWPNNSMVDYATIANSGAYSGGVIAGSPATNQAAYSYAGLNTLPTARTDTNRGGLAPVFATPAWLAGKALHTWYQIPNTAGFNNTPVKFGGFNVAGKKIVYFTSAGHGNGYVNAVSSMDLGADAPAWSTLMASSSSVADDVLYYPDGKPAARHTYDSTFYLPAQNKLLAVGFRYGYPGAATGGVVDAFNLANNTWDGVVPGSPGTSGSGYATAPANVNGAVMDASGNIWTTFLGYRYSIAGNSWTASPISNFGAHIGRYPTVLDSARNQLFGLSWNDGEGFSGTYSGMKAGVLANGATATTGITFNSSSALTAFNAQQGAYASMCYIPPLDQFWWAAPGSANVYVITPNGTATWDMNLLSTTGTPPSGVGLEEFVGRMKYMPDLGIVIAGPQGSGQNLYFRRVV